MQIRLSRHSQFFLDWVEDQTKLLKSTRGHSNPRAQTGINRRRPSRGDLSGYLPVPCKIHHIMSGKGTAAPEEAMTLNFPRASDILREVDHVEDDRPLLEIRTLKSEHCLHRSWPKRLGRHTSARVGQLR